MVRTQTIIKHRWLMLLVLSLASVIFTGCEKGSLGIKTGAITGYVIDEETNSPIADVLLRGEGTTGSGTENKSTYSSGDGSFAFTDCSKGSWKISVEKFGYVVATNTVLTATINNGETVAMSPIKMVRTEDNVKGTLRGYPIDLITGRAITNFTVTQETPFNERKSKTFETAADFRDTGWTGLEGGLHNYTITCPNYETFTTTTAHANGVEIGKSVANLGTIKLQPLTVGISGTLRNLPGYVLKASDKSIVVWAESAGKVVASYTELDANSSKGTITYQLDGIPVTAGSVSVKCKVKGYDLITISSAVSIAISNPGGVIGGIDTDFSTHEPITADLRVIVQSVAPSDSKDPSFDIGEVARVYVRNGGNNVVPYADVTSVNYKGEVTISGVITGYPIDVTVVNQKRGYCSGEVKDLTIPENQETYPVTVLLEEK